MTRIPPPGGVSGDSISVSTQELSDAAPVFTNASKLTYEQDLILDSMVESMIGELKLIKSLAQFADALEKFKERVSEIMHCLGNEESTVGVALEEAALAFDDNETTLANMYQQFPTQPNPIFPLPDTQPLPGITYPITPIFPLPDTQPLPGTGEFPTPIFPLPDTQLLPDTSGSPITPIFPLPDTQSQPGIKLPDTTPPDITPSPPISTPGLGPGLDPEIIG